MHAVRLGQASAASWCCGGPTCGLDGDTPVLLVLARVRQALVASLRRAAVSGDAVRQAPAGCAQGRTFSMAMMPAAATRESVSVDLPARRPRSATCCCAGARAAGRSVLLAAAWHTVVHVGNLRGARAVSQCGHPRQAAEVGRAPLTTDMFLMFSLWSICGRGPVSARGPGSAWADQALTTHQGPDVLDRELDLRQQGV